MMSGRPLAGLCAMDSMDVLTWEAADVRQRLAIVGVLTFAVLHLHLRSPNIFAFLRRLWRPPTKSQWQMDRQRRYETELQKTRLQNFMRTQKPFIHLTFALCVANFWRAMQTPTVALVLQTLVLFTAYNLHCWADGKVLSDRDFSAWTATFCCIHLMCALATFQDGDLVLFCLSDKLLGCTMGFLSIVVINYKVTLTLYAFEAVLLLYRLWDLIGFEHLTFIMIFASVAAHILCAATIAMVEITLRSNNAAKVDSSDASSLMLGFRHVLRGLCDGDLLLDRSSCRIVEDASCLERLLKSNKKLCDSSFLDLFLDTESQQRFLQFLNAQEDPSTDVAIPRGLRVSLQGAAGPVSMDLFHTRIPSQGTTGTGSYCLLAMKEDPEQKAPPDASPGAIPPSAFSTAASLTRTRSSETEIVDAYEELMELALLFSNETGLLDIREVHLVFHRQSWAPNIESGMPTLRRFIRPSDWDRIEQMIQNVVSLPPADIERRCYFRQPMLFRVPGASRSYICSRETYMCLSQPSTYPVDMQRPIYFRMHLSSFDSGHVLRPREQELDGIDEE